MGVLIMRKLIATVFNYSLDGLLADAGTEFWKFCFDLPEIREPDDPAHLDFLQSAYAHEAQGKRQARQECLAAGEGLDSSGQAGEPVDDLEAFGEPVPVACHRPEQFRGDGQEGLLDGGSGDDVLLR
jgi:hypothetical protein